MARDPIAPARGGGVTLRLPAAVRDLVAQTASQLRDLYASPQADDDPGIARLFPTPYHDDPLASITFDERIADELRRGRLEAIETVARTADARTLRPEEADAWLRTLNDARLILGTRLDVTEETTEEDFDEDPAARSRFELYAVLSAIVDGLVHALSAQEPPQRTGEPT